MVVNDLMPTPSFHLKLLQLAPLCLTLLRKDLFHFARPGWVPEEASSAQPFRGLLHMLQGETGVSRSREVNPDSPQRGPYEASEGIYPGHGQQKLGAGKFNACINKRAVGRRRDGLGRPKRPPL
jgi:hypothetical protein